MKYSTTSYEPIESITNEFNASPITARFQDYSNEIYRLRKELEEVHECAKGIMPIHEKSSDLLDTIVKINDAAWTRLYAIYCSTEKVLESKK